MANSTIPLAYRSVIWASPIVSCDRILAHTQLANKNPRNSETGQ